MMNVILVGATGAVGGELLKAAPQFGIDRLCVLVRRELETSGFANEEWYKTHLVVKKVSFDNVEAAVAVGVEALGGKVTHCISSLGTTKAKAKTAEGFKKIDYYLNYEIAKAAVKAGAQHYSIVSTLGANANSNFLYTQTKGQLDEDVQKLGFATVSIFRPPLILTEGRNESRPLEAVLQACSKWTDRGGWWSIHASKIALAIWAVAQTYTLSHSTQDNTPNISDDNTTQTTVTKIYDPKLIKEAARDWEKE
ncbi:putative NADH(P)-binding, PF13460 family protein, partial [Gregarina niphandrodes]